ncbi:hypothetical protein FNV43_RR12777 [Rhamnella rubrinervis]|uniref:Late embryogenesis abundant protein, LEA-25/LEA-D113 n=1 Tax=Rhamnella rubrinervis TaxID=2594499 RepID=A0A8K0MJ73_9ROSA|nr:hypothetical protein FNV43_RR12777 [Rhamnella rubrinervis]
MQAVKDKLSDMNAMRKAKNEARAEEKAEKEIAKARIEVAHEVRLAKEAEAVMDLHVAKAGQKAERELAKHNMSSSTTMNTHHPAGGPAPANAATNPPPVAAMAPPTNMPMAPPHGHGHGHGHI